ncbi:MAG: phytoene/squalene synthase family protein [Verrucomicrobiota bacterium]
MAQTSAKPLADLLKEVSRSFYLTLRVLPGAIRPQISLAYLLARATDTIADTEIVPMAQRLDALQILRDRILARSEQPLNFAQFAEHQSSPGERALLERCNEAIALLGCFSVADQTSIREVLKIITSGQELDIKRFSAANANQIFALATDQELDDYTYRVAGCVGEFWTTICNAHLFQSDSLDQDFLLKNGVRFGKGLQLVNILRDLPADLRRGRCYLPSQRLNEPGLRPTDLLDPANEPKFRALYSSYLDLAEAHLAAGWAYTNALPWRSLRVRLACAWPILIAVQTLAKLRVTNALDPRQRVKITRLELRNLIFRSVAYYPFGGAWRGLFKPGIRTG